MNKESMRYERQRLMVNKFHTCLKFKVLNEEVSPFLVSTEFYLGFINDIIMFVIDCHWLDSLAHPLLVAMATCLFAVH